MNTKDSFNSDRILVQPSLVSHAGRTEFRVRVCKAFSKANYAREFAFDRLRLSSFFLGLCLISETLKKIYKSGSVSHICTREIIILIILMYFTCVCVPVYTCCGSRTVYP